MSDPFGELRSLLPDVSRPNPAVIRARAGQIRARRVRLAGAAAVCLLALAFAGLVVRQYDTKRQVPVAQPRPPAQTSSPDIEPTAGVPSTGGPAETAQPGPSEVSGEQGRPAGDFSRPLSAANLRIEIVLSSETASSSMPVVMRLTVCNDQQSGVTVHFGTAPRHDFEIVRPSDGTSVWRWGANMQFEAESGSETFLPGCREFARESWGGTDQRGTPVAPGEYRVTGSLKSKPPFESQPRRICAVACP